MLFAMAEVSLEFLRSEMSALEFRLMGELSRLMEGQTSALGEHAKGVEEKLREDKLKRQEEGAKSNAEMLEKIAEINRTIKDELDLMSANIAAIPRDRGASSGPKK